MKILQRWRDDMETKAIPASALVPRPNGDRAAALKERHYADYAQALEDRDRAMQERDTAMERVRQSDEICAKATHRINGMMEEINHLKKRLDDQDADFKSRIMTYQIERDQAVAIAAELRSTLADIKAVVSRHETPARPVVATDAEAPELKWPGPPLTLPTKAPPTHEEMLKLVEKIS